MLDTFTIETFRPLLGEQFDLSAEGGTILLARLTEVHGWGPGAAANRDRVPFSLIFHTESGVPLPQGIYRIAAAGSLQPFELFLVPLGPDEAGMRYEAVFT